MSAFIRPDSSLIWEGPHNQILTSGTGKYQITFSNGSSDTAVDGSGTLVPSRVSTLTIYNPTKSDHGVYTCSVMGTNKTVDLVIKINDAKTNPATTASSDVCTETEASTRATTVTTVMDKTTNPWSVIGTTKSMTVTQATNMDGLNIVLIIGFTIAAVLVCLLAVVAAALCVLRCTGRDRKHNSSNTDSNPVYYDYPMSLPGDGGSHSEKGATALVSNDTLQNTMDEVKANGAYSVAMGGIVTMEMNAAYGVARDGIVDMETNADYGVVRDGIVTMEMNAAYGVARDGIDVMEMNAAYGVARDSIVTMETNAAYGVARDGLDAMEVNAA